MRLSRKMTKVKERIIRNGRRRDLKKQRICQNKETSELEGGKLG
jgi:hypothetical protein